MKKTVCYAYFGSFKQIEEMHLAINEAKTILNIL
jgi:hypothetical protein